MYNQSKAVCMSMCNVCVCVIQGGIYHNRCT